MVETKSYDVYRPETLEEALQIRANRRVIPFAGGTDLMVRYRSPAGALPAIPGDLLLLSHLNELKELRREGETLRLGAALSLTTLAETDAVPSLLSKAVLQMAAPGVRNSATLGGNIGNASPAGDSLPPLAALGAQVELCRLGGRRTLPLTRFFTGPGKTKMEESELITALLLPAKDPSWSYYRKVGTRRANALSKVSLAAAAWIEEGRVKEFSLSLGAAAPVILCHPSAGSFLQDRPTSEAALPEIKEALIDLYRSDIQPIDDQRSTAAYRRQVSLNLMADALENLSCWAAPQ